MRHSNYADLSFTDEEVLTIYLFGIIDGRRSIKEIYNYADRHLRDFFPKMPKYKAYDARINRLCDIFVPLIHIIQSYASQNCMIPNETINITDAMPIVMAQQGHRFYAKVAPEIATAGYCATKNMYYYGVKIHVVGIRRKGMLPLPHFIGLTHANMHDLKAYEQMEPEIYHDTYADKAYQTGNEPLMKKENYTLLTPPKKQKKQTLKDATDALLSTGISRVRQPIEALFSWLNHKTGIQVASKVRSYNGLIVHAFGKIATACLLLFNIILST
jgi:hypothetical protein